MHIVLFSSVLAMQMNEQQTIDINNMNGIIEFGISAGILFMCHLTQ